MSLKLITTDELFREEKNILEGIAEQESCVLAGRCGFFIFRKHPNHLSILIQASQGAAHPACDEKAGYDP